jgi:hypothetical protein
MGGVSRQPATDFAGASQPPAIEGLPDFSQPPGVCGRPGFFQTKMPSIAGRLERRKLNLEEMR